MTRVSAYGLVVDNENILLCRISDQLPRLKGQWTLPGGGLEFRESPIDAMIREVKEETGLLVESAGLQEVNSNEVDVNDTQYHGIRIIYMTNLLGGTLTNEIDGTTDLCQWWHKDELPTIPLVDLSQLGISLLWSN
ncbi:MAG: 8-oxo-dGTP diphosphatase [Candidatus Azotimanducaceae bacterium]